MKTMTGNMLEELALLMFRSGAVVRAIPEDSYRVTRITKDGHVNGKALYLNKYGCKMYVSKSKNSLGGKFLVAFARNQTSTVIFTKQFMFDTLEQVIKFLKSDMVEEWVTEVQRMEDMLNSETSDKLGGD